MLKTIFQFVGFHYEIIKTLGKDHFRKLFHLCLSILFTAFTSSLLIALNLVTIQSTDFGQTLFIAVVWFIFISIIDRAIVSAPKKEDDLLPWIRIAILIPFIFIHSAAIDLIFFAGDIEKNLNEKRQVQIDAINEKYKGEISTLYLDIENIQDKIQIVNIEINLKRENVFKELDDGNGTGRLGGAGPIFKKKYNLFKSDSIQFSQQILAYQKRIKRKDSLVKESNSQKQIEINNLQNAEQAGVVSRLSALHDVVFKAEEGENKLPLKIFYWAFLLVAGIIEATPLIAKFSYRKSIEAYCESADAKSTLASKVNLNRIVQEKKIEEGKHESQFEIGKVNEEYRKKIEINKAVFWGEEELADSNLKQFQSILKILEKINSLKVSLKYKTQYREKFVSSRLRDFLSNKNGDGDNEANTRVV